jgi:hypothetical protein
MGAVTETGVGTGFAAPPTPVELRFTPSSLDLRTDLTLPTGRRRVFDALLHIGSWWPHRVHGGASIVLEPRVGGRFFENCDDGNGVLLGQVARMIMPSDFAIEGSFGIDAPVTALWRVRLESIGHQQTALIGELAAFGAIDDKRRAMAASEWNATYAALAHYLDA